MIDRVSENLENSNRNVDVNANAGIYFNSVFCDIIYIFISINILLLFFIMVYFVTNISKSIIHRSRT